MGIKERRLNPHEIDEERFETDNQYRYYTTLPPPKCITCGEEFLTGAGMRRHLLAGKGRKGHAIQRDNMELWVGEDGDVAVYRFKEYHILNGKVNN